MSEEILAGGCLCGEIRYRVDGPTQWAGYCHCSSCRRFTGSVVTNWLGIAEGDLEFVGCAPAIYELDGVERGFCPRCGSSLSYRSKRFPGYVQLHVGSLDRADAVSPRAHVHHAEKLSWFEVADELPRFEGSAADGGDWR